MATGVQTWSQTASSNATADSSINWAEGQAPSSVNDSSRAMMARIADWYRDCGLIGTGGTSTAFTITSNRSFASLSAMDRAFIIIAPHADSGASPTLAVDGLAAKPLMYYSGVPVATGALKAGGTYAFVYWNATAEFFLVGGGLAALSLSSTLSVGGTLAVTGAATFSSTLSSGAITVTSGGTAITGNSSITGTLAVSSNQTIGGTLGVTGLLTASGGASITGTCTATTFSGSAASLTALPSAQGGSLVLIQTQTASSSSVIDFTTGLDDTYDSYMIRVSSLFPGTNSATLLMRIGTGAGPTYQSSNYYWGYNSATSSAQSGAGGTSDSSITVAPAISSGATDGGVSATIDFDNPDASTVLSLRYRAGFVNSSAIPVSISGNGVYNTAAAITGIRFLMSSGNIASGRFSLYGFKKS